MSPRADTTAPASNTSDARNLKYLCRIWSAKKGAPAPRPDTLSKAVSQPTRSMENTSVNSAHPRPAAAAAAVPAVPGAQSAPTASPVWVAFPHVFIPHRNSIPARTTTLPQSRRAPPTKPGAMVLPVPHPSAPAFYTHAAVLPDAPQACTSIDTLMDPALDLLFTSFA